METSNTYHGTFSYDSSIVVAGSEAYGSDLLTALDFTFNGATYETGNTRAVLLGWNLAGNLTRFIFGTDCTSFGCSVDIDTDPDHRTWFVGEDLFVYGKTRGQASGNHGPVAYAPADLPVPEPSAPGLFGLGLLLLGATGIRRLTRRASRSRLQ